MSRREDIAWAAGLFEGEGSFIPFKTRRHSVEAVVQITDEDVIRRFAAIVGFGKVYGPYHYNPAHKPHWRWAATGFEKTQAVAAMFWPWLGQRRRNRAAELLPLAPSRRPS